jgi:hypothetical protein
MKELFLINYKTKLNGWQCHTTTASLRIASETSKQFKDMGYQVTVQSILINEHGKVEI